jgi:hypothetical protein
MKTPCDHGIEKFRQTDSRKIKIDERMAGDSAESASARSARSGSSSSAKPE